MTLLTDVTNKLESDNIGEIVPVLPSRSAEYEANGYLLCDGRTIDQGLYPELYAKMINIPTYSLVTRTSLYSGTTTSLTSICYGNGLYVYGGNGGLIGYSTDALNWTTRTSLYSGTTSTLSVITYLNGLYFYGGNGGLLRSSTDAINWNLITSINIMDPIQALLYNDGQYIVLCAEDTAIVATSTNLINWYVRSFDTDGYNIRKVIYNEDNNNHYMVGGFGGIFSSTNVYDWDMHSLTFTYNTGGLVYNNGLYIYGSPTGGLYTSTNAINKISEGYSNSATIDALEYGNGLYVFSTLGLFLKTSTDAINISEIPVPQQINCMLYNDNKFVIGGNAGYIYIYQKNMSVSLPSITPPQGLKMYIKAL